MPALTVPTVAPDGDLTQHFRQLNNQLGIILANAELLEHRLQEEAHRARAGQVVASALEAIRTTQRLRQAALPTPIQ